MHRASTKAANMYVLTELLKEGIDAWPDSILLVLSAFNSSGRDSEHVPQL